MEKKKTTYNNVTTEIFSSTKHEEKYNKSTEVNLLKLRKVDIKYLIEEYIRSNNNIMYRKSTTEQGRRYWRT